MKKKYYAEYEKKRAEIVLQLKNKEIKSTEALSRIKALDEEYRRKK